MPATLPSGEPSEPPVKVNPSIVRFAFTVRMPLSSGGGSVATSCTRPPTATMETWALTVPKSFV